MTPLTIFGASDLQNISVLNMARLLQSLDVDGNTENGISIDMMAHDSAMGMSLDFASADFETMVATLVATSGSVTTELIDEQQATEHLQQTIDVLNQGNCTANHSKVGYTGEFETLFHGVMGTATVIDDCTIRVTNFSYDGQGPDVYFYMANDRNFSADDAFGTISRLNGTIYKMTTIDINLPAGKTLDDFNSISIWCVDVGVSFGELDLLIN